MTVTTNDWQSCNAETFWRDKTACSHVVQIYEDEDALLNLLENFVAGGITANESVLLIATKAHLEALEHRLSLHGLNLVALRASNQYIPLDAHDMLDRIMVNDCPDYSLFSEAVGAVLEKVRKRKRPLRAFGEMVAILQEKGNHAATVMLEHLWNSLLQDESFSLYCAYPQSQFLEDTNTLANICRAHTALITNAGNSATELAYQEV